MQACAIIADISIISEFTMSEGEKQEGQKTIVAFVAGLLIGGLLVWVFGSSPSSQPADQDTEDTQQTQNADDEDENTNEDANDDDDDSDVAPSTDDDKGPIMQTGDGRIEVSDQAAGFAVELESATFPNDEGWIGVRDYVNGQMGGLLGVVRFSKEQGLVPETVVLQRATEPNKTYAVVFYTESGDREFNLAQDVQVDNVFTTFTAQ